MELSHQPSALRRDQSLKDSYLAKVTVLRRIEGLRPFGSRMALFALLRQNARSESETRLCDDGLQIAANTIEAAMDVIEGTGNVDGCEANAVTWARDIITKTPNARSSAVELANQMRGISKSAKSDPDQALGIALDTLHTASANFAPAFLSLMQSMYDDLENDIHQRAASVTDAVHETQAAMERIADISQSVRLISLNASVEAARVGDAGRGFGVISAEIKTLSEAINTAGKDAATAMDRLAGIAMR